MKQIQSKIETKILKVNEFSGKSKLKTIKY